MSKVFKYIKSIFRIIKLKLIHNKRLVINIIPCKQKINYIGNRVKIITKGKCKINIMNGVYISDNCKIESIDSNINIGEETFFNEGCKVTSLKKIDIGNNCIIGPNVLIYDHDHIYTKKDILIKDQGYNCDDVIIGNNIWIGANTVITKGVIIEDNVIIAAGSIVTKSLKANSVYAGVPAKLIKSI